jgi:hypothetical protein
MGADDPNLPRPRGPLSTLLEGVLREPARRIGILDLPRWSDPLRDEDLQLSLYMLYELHYRGFADVDEEWEWEPSLLALRRMLEDIFESELMRLIGPPQPTARTAAEIHRALRALADIEPEPSLSRFIEGRATIEQVREFMIHRSAYQLKEADPHSWAIPRLHGGPKAALIEVQADEYGGGNADRVHAELFARAMSAVGLDPSYGAYLDAIPGVTLATVNLMSLLGLHRRHRGAICGHLALFEMTSPIPNRRYARGLRRLGYDGDAVEFFDEHVLADSVHENIAAVDLAGGLVEQDPSQAAEVLWGARALDALDAAWSRHVLGAWQEDRSSLRAVLPAAAAPVDPPLRALRAS